MTFLLVVQLYLVLNAPSVSVAETYIGLSYTVMFLICFSFVESLSFQRPGTVSMLRYLHCMVSNRNLRRRIISVNGLHKMMMLRSLDPIRMDGWLCFMSHSVTF